MTEIKTKQEDVTATIKKVTKYQCPLCESWHGSKKGAVKCSEKGFKKHKHAVGDVIMVGHYPGDSYEEEYFIINKLMWKNPLSVWVCGSIYDHPKGHDYEPVYNCVGQNHDCAFMSGSIKELSYSNEEREELKRRADEIASEHQTAKVNWSHEKGGYEVCLLVV